MGGEKGRKNKKHAKKATSSEVAKDKKIPPTIVSSVVAKDTKVPPTTVSSEVAKDMKVPATISPEVLEVAMKNDSDKLEPVVITSPMHLLENKWTLWFFQNDRSRAWEENQVQVATFGSVEDFWALYNHVEQAGRLPHGCDYSMFKEGIMPAWEDAQNREGGRWLIQLERGQKADTDRFWMEILMLLVGEAFETENKYICGCVVSVRPKFDKIAVWVSCNPMDASDNIMRIGEKIKDRLKLVPMSLTFETHADTSKKSSSSGRASLTI